MREIKFRAKHVNGFWVYGGGAHVYRQKDDTRCFMLSIDEYDKPVIHTVDAETVGQFTGLRDKNGREIYEGDIVRKDDPKFPYYHNATGIIEYETEWMRFYIRRLTGMEGSFEYPDGPNWNPEQIEVIGNIYEEETHGQAAD